VAGRNEGLDEQVRETEAALANLIPVEPPDLDRPVEDWVKALEINKGILEKLQKKVVEMTAGQEPRLWPTTCPVHEIPCPSAGKMAIEGTKPKGGNPEAMVKAQADLTEQENEVGLIEADLKAAKSVQAAYDGYCKQRDRLDAQVKELKAQQGGGGNGHAAENLARLEAEINNQTVLQNAINDFWADKDKADRARVMVEKCEVEAIFYDVLQKALAPAGIPSQMLSEALAPVNNLLAVAAAHLFPGRTLTLTPELNFSLEGAPILSKSAELRVGVAIQYVLAKLAGARLLMVDEVDMLDPGNRMNFIKFLLAVKADFDTVMAFTTAASASPAPVPDIGMWWVSGGGVAPLN
jgi:exonuclease SbcC